MEKIDITETLETLIDKHGLLHVLTGMEIVCSEKAEHARQNWQDEKTAKQWDDDAEKIYAILNKIHN